MLIQNANVFLPDGRITLCDVAFSDRITELGRFPEQAGFDATGLFLTPGFFDVHTHGALGCDFSDARASDLPLLARHYARHGVTSFLAATLTVPFPALCDAARAVGAFRPDDGEADCAGLFLEGPFLSAAKRGAQAEADLLPPDPALFEALDDASGGRVRMVSVAPELPGAAAFLRAVSPRCTAAIGHTAASYDEAAAGFAAGATVLTHLFNGMNPFLHRAPGAIGAAMDAHAYAELIVDGLHVHPSAVRAAFSLFPGRVLLISDSLRAAGMPDGEYAIGGQAFTLKDGRCTLKGTDTLAGSVITVHDALKNAVRFGVPLETAFAAATHNPARALDMDGCFGFIRPGLRADFVLMDASLSIRAVVLRGTLLPAGAAPLPTLSTPPPEEPL